MSNFWGAVQVSDDLLMYGNGRVKLRCVAWALSAMVWGHRFFAGITRARATFIPHSAALPRLSCPTRVKNCCFLKRSSEIQDSAYRTFALLGKPLNEPNKVAWASPSVVWGRRFFAGRTRAKAVFISHSAALPQPSLQQKVV